MLFGLAIYCVPQNIASDSEPEFRLVNGRLNYHALQIEQVMRRRIVDWNDMDSDDIHSVNYLESMMGRRKEAEMMYIWALKGREKAWGAEHTSTLRTVNNLGNLYKDQGKMQEAEGMLVRALKGCKEAYGANQPRVSVIMSRLTLMP